MNIKGVQYLNLYKHIKTVSNNRYMLSTTWSNPMYTGRGADGKGGRYCIIDMHKFNNGDTNYIIFTSSTLKGIKQWINDNVK